MSVTIRRLRSFIAVAKHQSFGRAAEELSTSQPALTAHIKDLEVFLGVRLLNRTTRRVILTREGEILLGCAQQSLKDIDSIVNELKQRGAVQRGRIIVGCTPSIAMALLPAALKEFRRQHPDIDVQIHDEASEVMGRLVSDGEVDFAVCPVNTQVSGVTFRHLLNDPFMALCPLNHPLASAETVKLKELLSWPLVMMRKGLSLRTELDQAFALQDCQLQPAVEVHHYYSMVGLIEAGLGFGILPRMTVHILQRRKLKALKIVAPVIVREFGFAIRQGETVTLAASQLIDHFRKAAQRIIA